MKAAQERGRHLAFGGFVAKRMDDYIASRPGMTVRKFVALSEVSSPTLYRWRTGKWKLDPERHLVDRFCRTVGADPDEAYGILGWGVDEPVRVELEPEVDPDVQRSVTLLLRKLNDPSVPESEKIHIRELLRYLAVRKPPGDDQQRSA